MYAFSQRKIPRIIRELERESLFIQTSDDIYNLSPGWNPYDISDKEQMKVVKL